jgi:CHAT domain-containing protein
MDLQGTDLVVLSACETGLGDIKVGDGVQGLQRAFLLSGARSLIMSLYSVPDTESRELMRDFYGSLKTGSSKAAALHGVELKILRERRTKSGAAHPFFWASFVLVGEPN